jgi:hypothetical protein
MMFVDTVLLTLDNKVYIRLPSGSAGFELGGNAALLRPKGAFVESAGFFFQFETLSHKLRQAGRVEVDIGHRGEKAFDEKLVDRRIRNAECAGLVAEKCQAFQALQQIVLQGCNLGLFAAHTNYAATGTFGRLFTLITKHGVPPSGLGFKISGMDIPRFR